MVKLRRLAVGPFEEGQLVTLEKLEVSAKDGFSALDRWLLAVDRALQQWPSVVVEEALCKPLTQGQAVQAAPEWPHAWVRVYSPENTFIGIGEVQVQGKLVPRRIFPPDEYPG